MKRTTTNKIELLATEAFRSNGFLVLNKTAIKQLGLIATVALSNYIDKYLYFKKKEPENEGWFYLTHEQQSNQIGLEEYSVKGAKNILIQKGILITKRRGIPAKEWFMIDFERLSDFFGQDPTISGGQDPTISGGQDPTISGGHKNKENIIKENIIKKNIKIYKKVDPKQLIHDNLTHLEWIHDQKFCEALHSYLTHRQEMHKMLTPEACKRLARKLSKCSLQESTQALMRSVENGWTGVFPEALNSGVQVKNPVSTGSRSSSLHQPRKYREADIIHN